MIGGLLVTCGAVLGAAGTWNGYLNARDSLAPLARAGDPTRAALEAARPLVDRPRVRRAVRHVALAIGWLLAALYGLFLVSTGLAVAA
jgi:hypothetical protein